MMVKLLIKHHLEFLSLKGDCRGSSESTYVQNATLLEISCTGFVVVFNVPPTAKVIWRQGHSFKSHPTDW